MAGLVGGALCCAPVGARLLAQEPTSNNIEHFAQEYAKKLVRIVGPQSVTVDPKTKTATIRIFNPTADTSVCEVRVGFAPPRPRKVFLAEALLAEDSVATDSLLRDSLRTDSLGQIWSLESWVQEPLPVKLWLAPKQTLTLTLHLTPPPTLKPGEYSAHVIVKTFEVKMVDLPLAMWGTTITLKDHFIFPFEDGVSPPAAVKLVYKRDAFE